VPLRYDRRAKEIENAAPAAATIALIDEGKTMTPRRLAFAAAILSALAPFALTPLALAQDTEPSTLPASATRPTQESAAATQLASSSTQHAPTGVPIVAGTMITYSADIQQIDAYLVKPQGAGPFPAVILVHDIYGLGTWTHHLADQLAGDGFLVLAPDLYTRQNLHGAAPDAGRAWDAWNNLNDVQAVDDLKAAVDFLSKQADVGDKPVGVVGVDMGGIFAAGLAGEDTRVKAAVSFYGKIIYTTLTPSHPVSPLDTLTNLQCPFLAFYGADDPQNTPLQLAQLQSRLQKNANNSWFDIVTYPKVGHGFLDPRRPGYNAAAAQDAMHRAADFLMRVLNAPPKIDQ
jgi:carboxymethylenebutenolidase